MDPSIMKLLEEDEDETMHSGADVEAFTAALNRDIEGDNTVNTSTSQPPTTLSQGTNHTPSQLFQQWKSSIREGNASFSSEQEGKAHIQEQQSSAMEVSPHGSSSESQHPSNETSRETSHVPLEPSRPQDKNPSNRQETNITRNPNHKSQLQRMHRMGNQQAANTINQPSGKQVSFALLLPVIEPQLDKNRAMQLHGLYVRLRNNNINKEEFVRHMRSLVGDHMLKMAVYKLQQGQEPMDQINDQHHKSHPSSKDETFEIMSSRPGSITAQLERQNALSKSPPKNPIVGQKKPLEAPASSLSKKQKVSGVFSDQSIEQLNDVTAASGVNLREEEEQLFYGSKEDSRISEASRKVVQEEEEQLILQMIPLQKKLAEIMAKCGVNNISNDVERCLSLCVEERVRGLISSLIRLSKQRVDIEKPRHRTYITSDVRRQIMSMNQKAREEWEKKQADAEKLQRSDEVNKEEDDKMRTTAANVAARAAVGGDDMMSKWTKMAQAWQMLCLFLCQA